MARLLFFARLEDNPKEGRVRQGDLVDAKPDGQIWGREERLPAFWQVDVPGEDHRRFARLFEDEREVRFVAPPDDLLAIPRPAWVLKRHRLRGLVLANLSAARRDRLQTVGQISLPWLALRGALVNKATGETEEGVVL